MNWTSCYFLLMAFKIVVTLPTNTNSCFVLVNILLSLLLSQHNAQSVTWFSLLYHKAFKKIAKSDAARTDVTFVVALPE